MKTVMPPESWRSEAFAEDIVITRRFASAPPPSRRRGVLVAALLGALPLALAVAGAVLTVLHSAS